MSNLNFLLSRNIADTAVKLTKAFLLNIEAAPVLGGLIVPTSTYKNAIFLEEHYKVPENQVAELSGIKSFGIIAEDKILELFTPNEKADFAILEAQGKFTAQKILPAAVRVATIFQAYDTARKASVNGLDSGANLSSFVKTIQQNQAAKSVAAINAYQEELPQ